MSGALRRIGHRGASAYAPENTMASFRSCLAGYSADIELDLRLTSDGTIAVLHDETVDRTTDGTGRISELTWAETRRLDAGRWFCDTFAGERIPSLREVLELLRGFPERLALLDIKVSDDELLPRIDAAAREAGVDIRQIVLGCWSLEQVEKATRAIPAASVAFIGSRLPDPEEARGAGASVLHVDHRDLTASGVASAHESGLRVWCWTVDTPEAVEQCRSAGVNGICGNHPDLL